MASPAPKPVSPAKPTQRLQVRHYAWLGLLIAVLTAAGIAGRHQWLGHRRVQRVQAVLPALPDPAGMPTQLVERFRQAQAMTASATSVRDGLVELAHLYHANSYWTQAAICWQALRELEPGEALWVYYLADLRRTASDYPGMVALLEETTKLDPNYAPAWLRLAEVQFKSGQLESADASYRRRLALIPGDPYARLGLARLALHDGRRDEARQLLTALVEDHPPFPTGHNLLAELLAADGNSAGARQQRILSKGISRFREAADPWLDQLEAWCFDYARLCVLGTLEYQTGHGDAARRFFERAIQLKPDEFPGYELLGTLYLKLNDPTQARDTLEHARQRLKDAKPTELFFVNLSHAYRELKQPEDAVRVAREGMALLGDKFELYDALGVALGDQGKYDQAVAALREAVNRNPNDTNANFNLALSLLSLNQLGAAVDALHRCLVLQPTFPRALLLLGRVEIDSGRWANAEQYLRPLYEEHPDMPEARQMMAGWHLLAGRDAEKRHAATEAENHYKEGLGIDPDNVELAATLGVFYLVQGRFPEAVSPLEAYHRRQPTNPQASLFLGQTYVALGRRDEARQILTEGVANAERAGNTTTARYCREILQGL